MREESRSLWFVPTLNSVDNLPLTELPDLLSLKARGLDILKVEEAIDYLI